jgi:hypothetical protein
VKKAHSPVIILLSRYLSLQYEELKRYLQILELEAKDLQDEDVDILYTHNLLASESLKKIFALKKVIDPLKREYYLCKLGMEDPVSRISTSIEELRIACQKRRGLQKHGSRSDLSMPSPGARNG